MFNSIEDRALSEHRGSGLFIKKASGKYSLLLPIEGTGENGATPNQLDKTAIGNLQATSVEGRQDNPQKTMPFFTHRDNIRVLNALKGQTCDFLRVLPDFTGVKYSGTISYKWNNTDVGSLEQGEITITPTTSDEYVDDCYSLLEDTALITSAIDDVIAISGTGTKVYNVVTNPADATIAVQSETTGVATVAVGTGTDAHKVTITGVANGSAVIKITASKTGYASFTRSVLVIDK